MGRELDFAQTGKGGLQGELNLIFIEAVRGVLGFKKPGARARLPRLRSGLSLRGFPNMT